MSSPSRKRESWHPAEIVLGALAVLFPIGPRFQSGVGNIYIATLITLVWWGMWILLVFAGPRGGLSVTTLPQKLLIGFSLWFIIGFIFHIDVLFAHPENLLRPIQLLFNIGIFLSVSSLRLNPGVPRRLLRLSFLVLAVECALTWFVEGWAVRGFLTGSFDGQHNHFGGYLVLMLSLLLAAFAIAGTRFRRFVLCILIGATLACLAFTFSRTAYVAAPVAIVALVTRRWGRRGFAFSSVSVLCAVAIAAIIVPESVRDRFSSIVDVASGEHRDISFLARLDMWRDHLEKLSVIGSFGDYETGRVLADNGFVYVLVTTGPIGFLLFSAFIVSLSTWLWRVYPLQRNREVKALALGLFGATMSVLIVMNLASDTIVVHRVMGVFWLLLGCLVALQNASSAERGRIPSRRGIEVADSGA